MHTYTKYHLDVPGLEEPSECEKARFQRDAEELAAEKGSPMGEQGWYEAQVNVWKEKSYTRLNGLTYTFTRDDF